MDEEQERAGSEAGICEWLIDQINTTTYIERLHFIAEVISDDKSVNASYLTEDCVKLLRQAWGNKKTQLEAAGSLPSVQGESTDRSEQASRS